MECTKGLLYPKSYIMPQSTDLFCHTILFAKLIMLTSFKAILHEQICGGAVLQGRLIIRSCHLRGSFTNTFSSKLKTLNLKLPQVLTYPQSNKNTFIATENPQYWNEVFLKSRNFPFRHKIYFNPFILIFFQFYCKINRNQLEIVIEATYGLHPY